MNFYVAFLLLILALSADLKGIAFSEPPITITEPTAGFSYTIPSGWHLEHWSTAKYPVACTLPEGNYVPNINVIDKSNASTFADHAKIAISVMKKTIPDCKIISKTDFVTNVQVKGIRLSVESNCTDGKQVERLKLAKLLLIRSLNCVEQRVYSVFPKFKASNFTLYASLLSVHLTESSAPTLIEWDCDRLQTRIAAGIMQHCAIYGITSVRSGVNIIGTIANLKRQVVRNQ